MKPTYLLAAFFMLASCSGSRSKSETQAAVNEKAAYDQADAMKSAPITRKGEAAPPPPQAEKPAPGYELKIIKRGSISISVHDLQEAKSTLDSIVSAYHCYYSLERLSNTGRTESYNLTVRIPSNSFEAFVDALEKGKGKFIHKEITASDVTDEFYDLKTRLGSKREYIKRYNQLLQKANSMKDMLEIEERIRALQEEIDRAEGRLKVLSDQVAFSTLSINLIKEKEYTYEASQKKDYGEKIKLSFSQGWSFISSLFLLLIKLWPAWVILAGVYWIWKRKKTKQQ